MARTNMVRVLLSDEEMALVDKARGHETLSSYVRRMIVGSENVESIETTEVVPKREAAKRYPIYEPVPTKSTPYTAETTLPDFVPDVKTTASRPVCRHNVDLKEYCPKCVKGKP